MEGRTGAGVGRHRIALIALLIGAGLLQCYHFNGPLLDDMSTKQIYIANKARSIARPPFDLLRNSFDFLGADGQRQVLTEEVPLYSGLLAVGYRLFGEHDWLGRVLSILATVVGLAAFYDLVRREFEARLALVSTFLLALCPLLLFYGRAVQPDAPMLACMLLAGCFHQRYLDQKKARWWIAVAAAGLAAALFKYYGLMVLLPLADLTRRRCGWKACFAADFLLLGAAMVGPIAVWMGGVFVLTPNPAAHNPYFIFQMPELFLGRPINIYFRFLNRFLTRDCGLVNLVLIALGAYAALFRGRRPGWMGAWTVMGLLFYVLLGPKMMHHDYYELMMLPAAAFWAGLGWEALWGFAWEGSARSPLWKWAGAAVLTAAAVVQSPWVAGGKYETEIGCKIVGDRLSQLCGPAGRVVVLGWDGVPETIHYSGREGWQVYGGGVPGGQWPELVAHYKALGADYAAVYLSQVVTPEQRAACLPLASLYPIVEHRSGPWSMGRRPAEYYILRLTDAPPVTPRE